MGEAGLGPAGLSPAGLGGGAGASGGVFDPGDGVASEQGAELALQTSQVAAGLARLIEQFKRKPKIQSLLRGWLQQVQSLEEALFELYGNRSLDTAIGEQLDGIGEIVGEQRLGRDDETYRLLLRARIASNRSAGTVQELVDILALLLPGTSVQIAEQFPASIVVEIQDAIDENLGSEVAILVRRAKAAGVKYLLHWFRAGDVFAYSDSGAPELASAEGFGAGEYSATSDGAVVHTFVP